MSPLSLQSTKEPVQEHSSGQAVSSSHSDTESILSTSGKYIMTMKSFGSAKVYVKTFQNYFFVISNN